MSHHLKVLLNSGLVETQREGNAIFYRRPVLNAGSPESDSTRALFELIDRVPLSTAILRQIDLIREQRAVQSRVFFARLGAQFKARQELICDYDQYANASFELLVKDIATHSLTVLEIGPGDGAFLKHLSPAYRQVFALDNSESMLDIARQYAGRERLTNTRFVSGDISHFRSLNQAVDAIVMNMVLHHIASPAEVVAEAAEVLNPGGVMVICDLAHHDQEWARENCGDLWLGFAAAELSNWALAAGLKEDDSIYIGLRNGFQIQLRRFAKPHQSPAVK
jgi:ArsR family transcriptional regulator